ncbi:acyltransferase family protein [Malikia sp.]|uniref:acyltransferase family protein n=1 Tax=Malikia sp. TaxID=2070706 RepID=UPI002621F6C2|nr:acyltransferase family protein [Malikia sp.]MDD2728599.1 acyltransferase family protein [Malikia sp.]
MTGKVYRPDIDGLRAVAVVSVILFHAGVSWAGGGFVGVDVFFVISGYLVGGIVLSGLARGDFSFRHFFERRFRRIVPPLLLTIALCLPFAWFWMMPDPFQNFGQSMVAATLSASNLLFERTINYFSPGVDEMPLVHTWSLGVEEQFYLSFPLLAWLLYRWGRNGKQRLADAVLLIVMMASLAYAIWLTRKPELASFYLPLQRFWELLIGTLCAKWTAGRLTGNRPQRELLAAASLGLLLWAILGLDEHTPWPGPWALLPVLATAVLLVTAPGTLVGNVLSSAPLVWIGLLSYGLYLLHQPVMAFARQRLLDAPSPGLLLALMLPTVVLARLSLVRFEQPVRNTQRVLIKPLLWICGVVAALLTATGLLLHKTDGLPQRLTPQERAWLSYAGDGVTRLTRTSHEVGGVRIGRFSDNIGANTPLHRFAWWGDSHADMLNHGIQQVFPASTWGAHYIRFDDCKNIPTLMAPQADFADWKRCENFFSRDFGPFLRDKQIDSVVVSLRWSYGLSIMGAKDESKCLFDNTVGGRETTRCPLKVGVTQDNRRGHDRSHKAEALQTWLSWLDGLGVPVVLVAPIPEVGWHVPEQMIKRSRYGGGPVQTPYSAYVKRHSWVLEQFESAVRKHPNLRLMPVSDLFCDTRPDGWCRAEAGEQPLYFDDDHLNERGGLLVAGRLLETLDGLAVAKKPL